MPDFDPRSAGHDYDWDALTPEDAVEIVLERLADLHEALANDWKDISPVPVVRPTRDDKVPPHIQMVRWMPILADYQMFAQRANKASKDARIAQGELESERTECHRISSTARRERAEALATLNGLKKHLRGAIIILDEQDSTDG
jgi:hypothetical protein